MYVIEKNVPVPLSKNGRPYGISKYPFHEMVIGDSFKAPISESKRIISAVAAHKRHFYKPDSTLITRKIDNEHYGVWCVAKSPVDMEGGK